MSFAEAILSFDGKSVYALKAAMAQPCDDADWVEIIPFLSSNVQNDQTASTWLVKSGLESGGKIEKTVLGSMLDAAPTFEYWEPKLHVLQCVQYFPDQQMGHPALKEFVNRQHTEKKLLVRVWALDAAVRIAVFEGDEKAARKLMQMANEDSPASMRARARGLRDEFVHLR